jgi:hypothetical protein
MTASSPFTRPWRVVEHKESFEVQKPDGRALNLIYFEDKPGRRSVMKRLSREDARGRARSLWLKRSAWAHLPPSWP